MPRVENKALRNYVYEHIRELIDKGELPIGEKINKHDLALKLGVSQTPINDSLNQLVGERFLEQRPRDGYYIREFSVLEFCELFEMRAALEGIAVRLCCENASDEKLAVLVSAFDDFSLPVPEEQMVHYYEADRKFHENVVLFAANSFILDALRTTGFQARTYQKGLVRGPSITLHEHRMVTEAIKVRDGERAQQQMIWHLLGSRDVFKARLLEK
ncbi:MAG: GntR family transcriptional regulator [Spirochaetales bacterium]|jgi:DNA-binding GntR family transcriptional regulator|nr:GntR family transcriptional regulator [Spirochaetales bacterium]